MSGLSAGLDEATRDMCMAAGVMVAAASVFPPCFEIKEAMPWGVGGPGSLAEGAANWGDGADALQQAQQALESVAGTLSADQWTGEDRDAFDQKIKDFAAQLGDSHNYAMAVGATLAGLSAPMAAYGPMCLTIGGVVLAESIAFEAAVASVVGNLGASEAIYAEGVAVAEVCATVITAWNLTMVAVLTAAGVAIEIADAADISAQRDSGNTTIGDDFKQAQVDGLAEAGKNLEGWAVSVAADKAGDKFAEGALPGGGAAEKELLKDVFARQVENDNKGVVDVATGEDPGKTITDTLGITPQVEVAEGVYDAAEEIPDNLAELINKGVHWGSGD